MNKSSETSDDDKSEKVSTNCCYKWFSKLLSRICNVQEMVRNDLDALVFQAKLVIDHPMIVSVLEKLLDEDMELKCSVYELEKYDPYIICFLQFILAGILFTLAATYPSDCKCSKTQSFFRMTTAMQRFCSFVLAFQVRLLTKKIKSGVIENYSVNTNNIYKYPSSTEMRVMKFWRNHEDIWGCTDSNDYFCINQIIHTIFIPGVDYILTNSKNDNITEDKSDTNTEEILNSVSNDEIKDKLWKPQSRILKNIFNNDENTKSNANKLRDRPVTGICWNAAMNRWIVRWIENGRERRKHFRIEHIGYEQGYQKAVLFRQDMERIFPDENSPGRRARRR